MHRHQRDAQHLVQQVAAQTHSARVEKSKHKVKLASCASGAHVLVQSEFGQYLLKPLIKAKS